MLVLFAAGELSGDVQPASAATALRQVEVGQNHACVLDANGRVACWGDDSNGQVSDWGKWRYRSQRFAQVSAGSFLTCGILTNGGVTCWGYPERQDGNHAESTNNLDWDEWQGWLADPANYGSVPIDPDTGNAYTSPNSYDGWVNTPPASARFKAGSLSVGNYHACAIKTNGELACWGKAGDARLVIPDDSGTAITDWTMVEAGFAHACGIREGDANVEGGSVVCFGRTSHNRSAGPSGSGPFIDVTLALYNGCALAADGSVECWGGHSAYNTFIHPSDPDQRAVNTQINTAPAGVTFTSIEMSTTELYGCGIADDKAVHCWGWKLAYPPQTDPHTGSFESISVGSFSNCAMDEGNYLTCWGIGDHGATSPPTGEFTQVDGGSNFGCAVKADQSVACWGNDGNRAIQEAPSTGTFTQVAADNTHACALKTDGTLQCWGGVYLSGTQYLRYAHAVAPSGAFTDIDAGPDLTCGVKTDGTLQCWGGNATPDTHDRLTVPSGSFSRVAVGATHVCAIKSGDKSIECWGETLFYDRDGDNMPDDINGKGNHTTTTPPSGTHRYIDITAGSGHTCAIREDKKAVCWGYHADGRNAVPGYAGDAQGFGSRDYSDIATGGFNNCAIRSGDGGLDCWNSEFRQYWPSSEVLAMTGFKSLGAGLSHMCAIDGDDELVCWGAGVTLPFPAEYGAPPSSWTAEATIHELDDGIFGCDTQHADADKHCTAALTDDDFIFDGVPLKVDAVYQEGGHLYIRFNGRTPPRFEDYTLRVGRWLHHFHGIPKDDVSTTCWKFEQNGMTEDRVEAHRLDFTTCFRDRTEYYDWDDFDGTTDTQTLTFSPKRGGRTTLEPTPTPPGRTTTTGGNGGGGGGGGGGGAAGNRPPAFEEQAPVNRSVPENSPAGTSVGDPVAAADPEGDRVVYRLIGPDWELFAIDEDTGQLTVKEGTALDHEGERNTYEVRVVARDVAGSGGTSGVNVTISVADVKLPGKADVYDVRNNHNEMLELDEALAAARDYFDGRLTLEEVLAIVRLYFQS